MAIESRATGFSEAKPTTRKRRMILGISGWEKEGKTHFALTAPGPISYHAFDTGAEGVVDKFLPGAAYHRPGLKVYTATYDWFVPSGSDSNTVAKDLTKVWDKFNANYAEGLKRRTTIVDTATSAYELVRFSYFGKLLQVPAMMYSQVNAEMANLFRQAMGADGNLIVLNRLGEEWVTTTKNGKTSADKTGKDIAKGWKDTAYETQVNIRCFREGGVFKAEVESCRHNPDIEGYVLEGDMCNFPTLGTMVYPETTEEDWQ